MNKSYKETPMISDMILIHYLDTDYGYPGAKIDTR